MSSPKNILVDLWLASRLAERLVEEMLAGTPLSPDEFALYGLIVDLGPVTATQLARWTGLPVTTLSTLVRRCEARGELMKVANPDDRRSSHLMLSAHGMALYRQVLPPFIEALQALHSGLASSENSVRVALQDLDRALRTSLGAAPRPYEVEPDTNQHQLTYQGAPLTTAQTKEALHYIEWTRHRDTAT